MRLIILALLAGTFAGCGNIAAVPGGVDTTHFRWSVEEAPDWSSIFIRNHGWLGGDGIFMVSPDGNDFPGSGIGKPVVMWFSDTQLGDVISDSLTSAGSALIHNSFGVLDSGEPNAAAAHFWWDSSAGKASPVFTPATPLSMQQDYYWLADGFVNTARENDLFIFGERIANSDDTAGFGFSVTGNTLLQIPANRVRKPTSFRQQDLPFFTGLNQDSTGFFGIGVLVNTAAGGAKNGDGYIYIYGGRKGRLIVARTLPEDIDRFGEWRFWNGSAWSNDPRSIRPVTDHISNELSMTPLEDGRYLLVFQVDGIATQVAFRLAASPAGPFGPVVPIYQTKDSISALPDLYSYNAKVHPVISKPGELIISYNVNSTNYLKDIKRMPHLYRPRFIRLRYSLKN